MRIYLLIFIVLLCNNAYCIDKIINGKKVSFTSVTYFSNGNLKSGHIIPFTKLIIHNVPAYPIFLEFDEKENIIQCTLASNITFLINNHYYEFTTFGCPLTFYNNGVIKTGCLSKESDVLTIADNKFQFTNKQISFYTNGSISYGCLSRSSDIYINGNLITLNPGVWVYFYNNGQLNTIVAYNSNNIYFNINNKIASLKNEKLMFYNNGNLMWGIISEEYPIDIKYSSNIVANGVTRFYSNTRVSNAYLKNNETILIGNKQYNISEGAISFYDDNNILSCFIKEDVNIIINNNNYTLFGDIYFRKDGTIYGGILKTPQLFNVANTNILFSSVKFYDNGNLMSGKLNNQHFDYTPLKVGNKYYNFIGETTIEFYENGNIKKGWVKINDGEDLCNFSRKGTLISIEPPKTYFY